MTQYEKDVNLAMCRSKNKYNHECIFSGHWEETIVGAHAFKRSEFPERAAWEENIFPLGEGNDALLEKVGDPWKRLCFIIAKTHPCFIIQVIDQIRSLVNLVMNEDHKGKGLFT